jgi:hypothetical protein
MDKAPSVVGFFGFKGGPDQISQSHAGWHVTRVRLGNAQSDE